VALIRCHGLSRTYTKGSEVIKPLDDLDLDVARGEFIALMGPSGSGKSTLLNLIAGIDTPTAGTLEVDGVDITGLGRDALARWRSHNIGYIFQLYNLIPTLTAYENVELPLLLHEGSRAARHRRVSLALELVSLTDRADHFPRQLSGGQEQRVAIARAIVTDPPIVVADEPTGDLDEQSAGAILDLLGELHQQLGKTFIMVTHDPRAAERAERVVHLRKGRLIDAPAAGADAP